MKKMFFSLLGLAFVCAASAQISVSAYGNYSKYGGDVSKGTPGLGLRLSYLSDRYEAGLSFTNGFAIKIPGTATLTNTSTGATKSVATEGKLSFKTISLMGNRTLVGSEESTGKFYFGLGGSFVLANYKESITES